MEEYFLQEAINEAKIAAQKGEVPVGVVIVKDNKIIASGHNVKEHTNDPTNHAEIVAIRNATKVIGNWRLSECDMYVTLEPCTMCAGAIVQSRIRRLYIGTFDPKAGGCGSVFNITQSDYLNHWVNVIWMYNEECSDILQQFFQQKRRRTKNE